LVTLNYDNRIRIVDGDQDVLPGIRVHRVGGHTAGLQIVTVQTARGTVVLTSDASHFYRNVETRQPVQIITNLPEMLEAFETMPATLLMLPPQTKTTHQWAERLALDVPDVSVIVAEDADKATRAIAEADCAFGTLPRAFLAAATRLRWLQAPQAAPPAGWYYPE